MTVSTKVGCGGTFAERPGQPEADDFGGQHRDRLAEHGGFGLDPADTPAHNAKPLSMVVRGRCRRGVGKGDFLTIDAALRVANPPVADAWAQVLKVYLMDRCRCPGGTTGKFSSACWPHLRNL